MPSLSQILREHPPLLLLDASSERIQAGLLTGGPGSRWASRKAEAGVGVFECIEELAVDFAAVGAFAFCEGPGSILGIRTTAMALRVWNVLGTKPTYSYQSLAVSAQAAGGGSSLIADARRSLWHRFKVGGILERVPASELTGELLTPEGFRHWDPLPPGTAEVSYDLALLLAQPSVAGADLFRETTEPDAFLHEEPSYAKWTPQIHRAP
jgi:tRNA threonylcarbamoyladenosine biosynthesis protein TsaB